MLLLQEANLELVKNLTISINWPVSPHFLKVTLHLVDQRAGLWHGEAAYNFHNFRLMYPQPLILRLEDEDDQTSSSVSHSFATYRHVPTRSGLLLPKAATLREQVLGLLAWEATAYAIPDR